MADIFEILNSISNKEKLQFSPKDYNPFMVNRFLSSNIDCLFLANEMNKYPMLDKEIQYTFLFVNIRKQRRRFSFKKNVEDTKISLIMKFFGYNRQRAIEVEGLITDEQVRELQERFSNE